MIRNALYTTLRTGAAFVAGMLSLATMMSAQAIPAARMIASPINNADRISLSGSLRPEVKHAVDLGPVNTSLMAHHVTLVLQRSTVRQAALDQYLSNVQNPKSAEYHHWLTPSVYGSRFGASTDDVQAIATWLQSQGLSIEKISSAANMIMFTGSVGQLQTAFSTSIHSLSVNGETHMANVSEPLLPRALAPAVKSLLGLNDFHPRSNAREAAKAKFNTKTSRIEPELTLFDSSDTPYLYADPGDIATIYDTPNAALNTSYKGTTYDGTGITVGVAGDSDVDLAPVSNYHTAFLGETSSNVNLPTVIVDGADPGTNNDEVESWLDLEVLGGIAPKATINYYTSDDSDLSSGLFNAIYRAINDNTVSILSVSFGECEANTGAAEAQSLGELFQQASAQGITVTVSSGDSGAAGCDNSGVATAMNGLGVNGLGSSPYVTSVGGTDYDALAASFATYVTESNSGVSPYYVTALSYIPEKPWNDSTSVNGSLASNQPLLNGGATDIIGGGGGKSIVFTKPAFQSSLTPADGARDVPDVSFLAGNGLYGATWVLCQASLEFGPDCATTNGQFTSSSRFSGVGGTSAATPAFAGMLALVEQAMGSRLGNVNSVLYKLAADKYSTVFHDITNGNNAVVCTSGTADCGSNGFTTGYDAAPGYDLASGLGSVDAAAMLANWTSAVGVSSATTLQIDGSSAPVSVVHGTSLNFAVDVNPTSATGTAALVATTTASATSSSLSGQNAVVNISNGAGTVSYNGLPGGQYTVYASYGGDNNTAGSQSAPIDVNISSEPSSTKLWVNAYTPDSVSLPNLTAVPYGSYIFAESSVYGTAEGYDASLGFATGAMTVYDNGTNVGTSPITSGNLSSFPSLVSGIYPYAVGNHILTEQFPGDASYSQNTSNVVSFTVAKGQTTMTLYPNTTSVEASAIDDVQAFVGTSSLGLAPTGTMTLTSNGTNLGNSSIFTTFYTADGSVASYVIFPVLGSELTTGANTVVATYSGDQNYGSSTGSVSITKIATTFLLRTTPITITPGSNTGNTATVTATSTTGFAGLVNLSCAVTSTPSNPVSPITCSIPAQINMTGTTAATTTLTVSSTATTTSGTYVVTITGTDVATGKVTESTTSTVTVIGTPSFTLSNSAPITLAAGATTGNSSTISVTPSGGYSGTVGLACTVTTAPSNSTSPITCTLNPKSLSITGTTALQAVLTIGSTSTTTPGTYVVTIKGTDSSASSVTASTTSAVTVTGAAVPSIVLSNSGPIAVTGGATTGNTSTITVSPLNSYAGTVGLSCAVTTAPAGAASPVTCAVAPGSVTISGTTAPTATLSVGSTASTTAGTYVVTITGADSTNSSIKATTTSTVTVTASTTPAITLTNSGPITLTAGANTGNTSTLTITPANAYTGSVALSCAVTTQPANAMDPITCTVAPGSVTISGGTAATAVLSIGSTPRTTGMLHTPFLRGIAGTVLAIGLFFWVPSRRRRKLPGLLAMMLLVSLGSLVGCGGSSSPVTSTTQTGTTAGTYVVTVTAIPAGAGTQTTTVQVGVN